MGTHTHLLRHNNNKKRDLLMMPTGPRTQYGNMANSCCERAHFHSTVEASYEVRAVAANPKAVENSDLEISWSWSKASH